MDKEKMIDKGGMRVTDILLLVKKWVTLSYVIKTCIWGGMLLAFIVACMFGFQPFNHWGVIFPIVIIWVVAIVTHVLIPWLFFRTVEKPYYNPDKESHAELSDVTESWDTKTFDLRKINRSVYNIMMIGFWVCTVVSILGVIASLIGSIVYWAGGTWYGLTAIAVPEGLTVYLIVYCSLMMVYTILDIFLAVYVTLAHKWALGRNVSTKRYSVLTTMSKQPQKVEEYLKVSN